MLLRCFIDNRLGSSLSSATEEPGDVGKVTSLFEPCSLICCKGIRNTRFAEDWR